MLITSPLGRFYSRVEPERADAVAAAIVAGDAAALHDFDFTPFWCRICEQPYCSRHWSTEVVMDEDFYDCTYGTCPRRLRTIIDD